MFLTAIGYKTSRYDQMELSGRNFVGNPSYHRAGTGMPPPAPRIQRQSPDLLALTATRNISNKFCRLRKRLAVALLYYTDVDDTFYWRYVPLVSAFLWGPGAFLPRPEDRRQPPFLDQLYACNGGCSTTMCHWVGAGALKRGRDGEAG
ncbi:unnamed protein product [Spodoptera exigua]|nr:unnamed protein product [Spodoptera exigua]